jgi:hypothetical protein
VPDEEYDIEAIAEAVRTDQDGYTPPEEMTAEPAPVPALNLAAQIAQLTMPQKLKLALRGNREARAILMRDSSIMVQRFLIENPRLTEDEVVSICKSRTIDSEILSKVAKRREWMRNYQVRHALVTNPRTLTGLAVGLVATLQDRDLRMLTKSHNVPSAVVATARRIVMGRGL